MAVRILALVIIAVLVLFPTWSVLRRLRRASSVHGADDSSHRVLREAPRQLVVEIVVLVLFLAALAIAVLMHAGPF